MCGSVAPGLEQVDLSLEDIRTIFGPSLVSQLQGIDFCGSYGDPAMAPDLLAIVDHFRLGSPGSRLVIFSNGGLRAPAWWRELASVLGRPSRVVFGIDGIGDTNAVYRRNVVFDRVMANARAFIEAGGEAQWDFLVFKHNESQLAEAEALSREMGFAAFQPKRTGRFIRSLMEYVPELQGRSSIDSFPIYASDGTVADHLEPPVDRRLVHGSFIAVQSLGASVEGLARMMDRTPIACRVKRERSVFVGAQGYVFPCCQTYGSATLPDVYGREGPDTQLRDVIMANGGFRKINAREVGLRAAVESEMMARIEESWGACSVAEGKLRVCARVCGTELATFENQFWSPELVPGLRRRRHLRASS